MPTYEYICDACAKEYEKFQSIMSKPDRVCPSCKARKVRRKIGIGSAVIFKGSGFYETDYRSEGYTKAAEADRQSAQSASQETSGVSADAGAATNSAGTSDAKSDAKSDSKSGATSDGKSSAPTAKSNNESDSSNKRGSTSGGASGTTSVANSNGATVAKKTSASSENSSSNGPRSTASTKQHMASKAVHPSRVGRGKGNLRRKKK